MAVQHPAVEAVGGGEDAVPLPVEARLVQHRTAYRQAGRLGAAHPVGQAFGGHADALPDAPVQRDDPGLAARPRPGEGVEVLSFLNYDLGESEKKYLENHLVNFPIVENSKKFGDDFFGLNMFRPIVAIVDKRGIIRHFYDVQKLHQGFKGHVNELLEENKRNLPTYDFMEKVKILLRE